MNTTARVALVLGQVLGFAVAVLGVLVLWGLGWTLLIGGTLLLVGTTALEATLTGRPARPSDRRSAPQMKAVG